MILRRYVQAAEERGGDDATAGGQRESHYIIILFYLSECHRKLIIGLPANWRQCAFHPFERVYRIYNTSTTTGYYEGKVRNYERRTTAQFTPRGH